MHRVEKEPPIATLLTSSRRLRTDHLLLDNKRKLLIGSNEASLKNQDTLV